MQAKQAPEASSIFIFIFLLPHLHFSLSLDTPQDNKLLLHLTSHLIIPPPQAHSSPPPTPLTISLFSCNSNHFAGLVLVPLLVASHCCNGGRREHLSFLTHSSPWPCSLFALLISLVLERHTHKHCKVCFLISYYCFCGLLFFLLLFGFVFFCSILFVPPLFPTSAGTPPVVHQLVSLPQQKGTYLDYC